MPTSGCEHSPFVSEAPAVRNDLGGVLRGPIAGSDNKSIGAGGSASFTLVAFYHLLG
jgi:hypothetical protein